jgi:hypothetical protein
VSSEQEKNKALARRFLEATARGDLGAMDEMMAPEFADRSLMPGQEPDREGSRTRRRTAGSCAPWATRSRRYGVSSTPVGRRSEYRNSASAKETPVPSNFPQEREMSEVAYRFMNFSEGTDSEQGRWADGPSKDARASSSTSPSRRRWARRWKSSTLQWSRAYTRPQSSRCRQLLPE